MKQMKQINQFKRLVINAPELSFLERIYKLPKEQMQFFIGALYNCPNPDEKPSSINTIDLQKYSSGPNYYDYRQKPLSPQTIIMGFKRGFTQKEHNIFTGDWNFIDPMNPRIIKSRTRAVQYYPKIQEHFEGLHVYDDHIEYNIEEKGTFSEEVFDPDFIDAFIDYIGEWYHKGLWLNHFNTYSIRYNSETGFSIYDPDVFYVVKDNFDINEITTELEFFEAYEDFKLRMKTTVYNIDDPAEMTDEEFSYLYWNYHFLEHVAQRIKYKIRRLDAERDSD